MDGSALLMRVYLSGQFLGQFCFVETFALVYFDLFSDMVNDFRDCRVLVEACVAYFGNDCIGYLLIQIGLSLGGGACLVCNSGGHCCVE